MKKYVLNENTTIRNKNSEFTINKGLRISSDGYVDEDGGIKGIVNEGKYKGMEIIFNISELTEII